MQPTAYAVIICRRLTTRICSACVRERIADHHPDMQRTDEQIRERVAAYELEVVA